MNRLRWSLLLWATLTGIAGAANTPAAVAPPAPSGLAISLDGQGPYYQLSLPLQVQAGAQFADLRDLQLRNQQGTALPFAWLNENPAPAQLTSRSVPLFAVPVQEKPNPTNAADPNTASVSATLHLGPNGELQLRAPQTTTQAVQKQAVPNNEWIIDARNLPGSLIELRLTLPSNAQGLFPFSLQTSSDPNLRQWRAAGSGQIARLKTSDGQPLEQLAVPLDNLPPSFIRLRFQSADAPRITEATLSSSTHPQTLPVLQWSDALTPIRCTSAGEHASNPVNQYCDYPLPHNATADSLRLRLDERNTLATLTVSGLWSVNAPVYPARQRRNPLYRLTHLRPPPAAITTQPAEREQWLSDAVVYRLQNTALTEMQKENSELVSPDIVLDGGHYSHLRLRTQGAFARLGARPPVVQLGSYPKTVLFLAQGAAPYTLHWDTQASSAELPLATLLPQQRSHQPLPTDRATVVATEARPAPVTTIAAPKSKSEKISHKRQPAWLWGVLVAALAVLGGMAWSLFKQQVKRT